MATGYSQGAATNSPRHGALLCRIMKGDGEGRKRDLQVAEVPIFFRLER
jgi:hypothetical protein